VQAGKESLRHAAASRQWRPYQLSGQVLKVVTGRFHPSQNDLRPNSNGGLFDRLTQLLESGLKNVDLKGRRHDLAQCIMQHHDMKVLVDVYGDAQYTLKGNATNLVGKGLAALAAQVGTFLSAHCSYLLLFRWWCSSEIFGIIR
jgi:hypothetical protein